jgi:hypothetical protein
MRRLALSSLLPALLAFPLGCLAQQIVREGGRWVQVITGSAPAASQLRIQAEGPVTLEGGVSKAIEYSARVSVRARSEAEARRMFERYAVEVTRQGSWTQLASPGGDFSVSLYVRAPHVTAVSISTVEGNVDAAGVSGSLEVESGAGRLSADRIAGNTRLSTQGGAINAGEIQGALDASTWVGNINVRRVGGRAALRSMGGSIDVQEAGAAIRAETGGGGVLIAKAGGSVDAVTAGGRIWVGAAGGAVTARNGAGAIQVASAPAVRCESGAGRIMLSNIAGSMQASTGFGSIEVVLPSRQAGDSYLATGNGDITLTIPSNVGVTIQAENDLADSPRRIVSEFPQVPVRVQGLRLVAGGAVNGGGPLMRISAKAGTITIKRQ